MHLYDFLGKNLILRFLGQKKLKWNQNEVFQVLLKIDNQSFSIFFHGVTVA